VLPLIRPTLSCHRAIHASFPLSQDELAASALSFSNALSCCLPSQAETKALNLHFHRKLPSSDHPTPTLLCYKKIISTLVTLPTTQPRLHFTSSLTRAPCHWSSTCRRHSLPPLSHAHHFSVQWHPRWRTNWSYSTSRRAYRYINSHKKYFKILHYHVKLWPNLWYIQNQAIQVVCTFWRLVFSVGFLHAVIWC
jgi:hypothetical protein